MGEDGQQDPEGSLPHVVHSRHQGVSCDQQGVVRAVKEVVVPAREI